MWLRSPFVVATDRTKLQFGVIYDFLKTSYWSPGIPEDVVRKAIANSLCFGLYHETVQIGFARIVSDYATFAYLADVFVLQEWRGRGLSKFMMECIQSHPDLQDLRRWTLTTFDAHGLYRQFGFTALKKPERSMEIVDAAVYQRMQARRMQAKLIE